jgi:hypothetical protein
MPTIPDQYLDCSVFLYANPDLARKGNTSGGGSGFLVSVPVDASDVGGPAAVYVVTNGHCADHVPTLRINLKAGGYELFTPSADDWVPAKDERHDDVSAYPIQVVESKHDFHAVPIKDAVMDPPGGWITPGADAFFVGRYVTYSGIERNTPMVRFGNISMMPQEPIDHPQLGQQDSFLVEARSHSGFSGSPVFTFMMATSDPGGFGLGSAHAAGFRLLGIVWGHLREWEPVHEKETAASDVVPDHYSGRTRTSHVSCQRGKSRNY